MQTLQELKIALFGTCNKCIAICVHVNDMKGWLIQVQLKQIRLA